MKLARALKAIVKGRPSHYDELVDIETLAANAGHWDGYYVISGLLDDFPR